MMNAACSETTKIFSGGRLLPHLVVALLLNAIFLSASDLHPNLQYQTRCAICKVSQNLSCGEEAAPFSLLLLDCLKTGELVSPVRHFTVVAASPLSSRSPPGSAITPDNARVPENARIFLTMSKKNGGGGYENT